MQNQNSVPNITSLGSRPLVKILDRLKQSCRCWDSYHYHWSSAHPRQFIAISSSFTCRAPVSDFYSAPVSNWCHLIKTHSTRYNTSSCGGCSSFEIPRNNRITSTRLLQFLTVVFRKRETAKVSTAFRDSFLRKMLFFWILYKWGGGGLTKLFGTFSEVHFGQ